MCPKLQCIQSQVSYLHDAFEGLVALLVGSTLGQVPPDTDVLPEENLTVLLKPVEHLGSQWKKLNISPPGR